MRSSSRHRSRSETVPTSKPDDNTLNWPHLEHRKTAPVVSEETLWQARMGATKLQEREQRPIGEVAEIWQALGLAPTPGRRRD